MGQYNVMVNLDLKEYLSPHAFGDGAKFLEATAGGGTLTGLLSLLVTGNGGGGAGEFGKPLHALSPKDQQDYANHKQIRTPSPLYDIVGSWAGCRIIVAGDYAKDGHLLTAKERRLTQQLMQHEQDLRYAGRADRLQHGPDPIPRTAVNVYQAATRLSTYTEISAPVLAMLTDCEEAGFSHWRCQELVDQAFARRVKVATEPLQASMYNNLDWLTVEDLDCMLSRANDREELTALKTYLRKRLKRRWQLQCLPAFCFKADGLFRDGPRLRVLAETHTPRKLLPSPAYMQAALKAELAGDTALLIWNHVQDPASPRAPAGTRRRNIQLPAAGDPTCRKRPAKS